MTTTTTTRCARRRGTERQRTVRNSGVPDQSLGGGPVRRLQSVVSASNTTNMQMPPHSGRGDGRGRVAREFGKTATRGVAACRAARRRIARRRTAQSEACKIDVPINIVSVQAGGDGTAYHVCAVSSCLTGPIPYGHCEYLSVHRHMKRKTCCYGNAHRWNPHSHE